LGYVVPSAHGSGDQSLGGDPGAGAVGAASAPTRFPVYDSNVGFRGVNQGVLPLDEPGFLTVNQGPTLVLNCRGRPFFLPVCVFYRKYAISGQVPNDDNIAKTR
jgi:hypothetical protein